MAPSKPDLHIAMPAMRAAVRMHHAVVRPDQLWSGDAHGVRAEQIIRRGHRIQCPEQLELRIHKADVHIRSVVPIETVMLMEPTKYCSLELLTAAMFEVGGQYRRNM